MKIFAALGANNRLQRVISQHGYPNVLTSYAYAANLGKLTYQPKNVVLDSGAFTAWASGKEVDIAGYSMWARSVQANRGNVRCVNLDVIPGQFGRTSTQAEREYGMKASVRNADRLRRDGLDVMEVFHQDEPFSFLDLLLERLPERGVLGISPRNDVAQGAKLGWQAEVLRYLIVKHKVTPKTMPRMHGLAVTAGKMLHQFPYYSVDSSSWQVPDMYGRYVDRDGRTKPMVGNLVPHSVGRSGTNTGEAVSYAVRKGLDNLSLLERDVTTLWANRGVRFID